MGWRGHSNYGKVRVIGDVGTLVRVATSNEKDVYSNQMETWTQALWCDVGEHPFSSKDPDKHSFGETRNVSRLTGNSYGQPVYQDQVEETDRITICGPCYAKQRPFQKLSEIPPGVDKKTYTRYLEEQAGMTPLIDDIQ